MPMRLKFLYHGIPAKVREDALIAEQAEMDKWKARADIHRCLSLNENDAVAMKKEE